MVCRKKKGERQLTKLSKKYVRKCSLRGCQALIKNGGKKMVKRVHKARARQQSIPINVIPARRAIPQQVIGTRKPHYGVKRSKPKYKFIKKKR